jgi:hypothetical protein
MTPETKTERWALYDQLRQELYGPIGRLRRERSRDRSTDGDPGVLMRRLRDLTEAVGDGKA